MSVLHTIDLAHPPRPAEIVEEELEGGWHLVRRSKQLRLLKVVHGYGSSGRGGTTRTVVRNWAFAHRRYFRAVIEGERYTLFDEDTQAIRQALGAYDDPDLGGGNPGCTILWIH